MFSRTYLCHIFFAFITISNAQRHSGKSFNPQSRAKLALSALQTWYNETTGLWESTGWWNGGNIVTTFGDYAKAFPGDAELQALTINVFSNALSRAPSKNPQPGVEDAASNGMGNGESGWTGSETGYSKELDPVTYEPRCSFPPNWEDTTYSFTSPDPHDWLDGFYDDDLWWALAWINAYDVTHQQTYLDLAEGIFLAVSKTWGTYCSNGGIYWSWKKDYVNAIANELFLSTAAHLANRVEQRKSTYLAWAKKSLDWFFASGMINSEGTINDGLTDKCENNEKTVWSYNQGVILGGLVELHRAEFHPKYNYLKAANNIAEAAIIELSGSNGVIHDACEPSCGADGAQFKGIFMRNLVLLQQASPNEMFAETIRVNADSIWENDRVTVGKLPFLSVDWDGPFIKSANASTQSSAMDALVAAVVTV
jgi:predicted alpha-1,6-mannanase (GH76 family)